MPGILGRDQLHDWVTCAEHRKEETLLKGSTSSTRYNALWLFQGAGKVVCGSESYIVACSKTVSFQDFRIFKNGVQTVQQETYRQ